MAEAKAFEFGGITVAPGERGRGSIELTRRLDGTPVGLPFIVVNGAQGGPVLLVDGGTHGDETEGILAVQRLAEVDPAGLRGTLLLVPTLNYRAAEGLTRVTPKTIIGDPGPVDVNRVFPGKPDGSTTARLADVYATQVIPRANYMISCHGGNASIMVGKKVLFEYDDTDYGRANMELAEALGWEVLCTSLGYAGTSTAVAKEHGIPSIVPECGGADRTTAAHLDAIESIVEGIHNVCRHLGMLDGEVKRPPRFVRCDVNEHVHAGRDGWIRYERDFDLGAEVKKGQRIGALLDVYGDEVQELTSDWDGIITLVRRYPFAQTGDWICSVTLPAKV